MQLTTTPSVPADVDVVGVPVFAGRRPGPGPELDLDDLAAQGFEGTLGQTARQRRADGTRVVALGLGDPDQVSLDALRRAAASLVRAAWREGSAATTLLQAAPAGLDPASAAQVVAEGAALAAYRFTRYKKDPDDKACKLASLAVVAPEGGDGAAVERGLRHGAAVADGVVLARDLVNTPPADLGPADLAAVAVDVAGRTGLEVEVIDEVEAASLGLGGLLGVGGGSASPPRMVKLAYRPEGATATVALVGKGITFDSGGLSLKPNEGMATMKCDMSGAAAVLGAMSVLGALGLPVGAVGFLCLAENMPSGSAVRLGDVLRIRNGTTVEVMNTDAEGRLVLADGLSLAAEERPAAIVDLATLTGACTVALGRRIAGVMGNHDGFVEQVRQAGARAGEPSWPLPLPDDYRKGLDSDVADLKNVSGGRDAGALIAGLFLQEFVDGLPWAHLDIAGPAFSGEEDAETPKGGTGFGVRTIVQLLASFAAPPAEQDGVVTPS